jgi:hypothetical protein
MPAPSQMCWPPSIVTLRVSVKKLRNLHSQHAPSCRSSLACIFASFEESRRQGRTGPSMYPRTSPFGNRDACVGREARPASRPGSSAPARRPSFGFAAVSGGGPGPSRALPAHRPLISSRPTAPRRPLVLLPNTAIERRTPKGAPPFSVPANAQVAATRNYRISGWSDFRGGRSRESQGLSGLPGGPGRPCPGVDQPGRKRYRNPVIPLELTRIKEPGCAYSSPA